jgi:precorrin-6Y C5,15-methyltransferase (decarboxylating)
MTAPAKPWLTLIGIGEDGADGLIPAAREALAQARLIVGGARHLALAGPLAAETLAWPSPIGDAAPLILARRGEPVAVLASGDPFFYGVGTLLAALVGRDEMICFPAPSAFSLAAARLHWSLQDATLMSLHGRDFERIVPALQPGARILCLAWDETTAPRVAKLLCERGLGRSTITVLEAMGGPGERIRASAADAFDMEGANPLNLVAIEVAREPRSGFLSIASGRDDGLFEHDGQLTKRHIRAITLSSLIPQRGDLLIDVGSGSGSIAIEWLLLDPANRAIAIEQRPDRAERILRNANKLGAPRIEVIVGAAPAAFDGLPRPDAIFIGGGASDVELIEAAFAALAPGGRLVVNAVTLEAEAVLIARFRARGGELTRIGIARADPLGGFYGWRPALPITQWAVTK